MYINMQCRRQNRKTATTATTTTTATATTTTKATTSATNTQRTRTQTSHNVYIKARGKCCNCLSFVDDFTVCVSPEYVC